MTNVHLPRQCYLALSVSYFLCSRITMGYRLSRRSQHIPPIQPVKFPAIAPWSRSDIMKRPSLQSICQEKTILFISSASSLYEAAVRRDDEWVKEPGHSLGSVSPQMVLIGAFIKPAFPVRVPGFFFSRRLCFDSNRIYP